VGRIAHDVAGGEHRELGHQLGDVESGNGRQLQVAAGHGRRLGALLEQRSVQVDLDIKFAGGAFVQVFLEDGPHLGVPVIGHGRCRNAQQDFVLGLGSGHQCAHGQGDAGSGQQGTTDKGSFHVVS